MPSTTPVSLFAYLSLNPNYYPSRKVLHNSLKSKHIQYKDKNVDKLTST